MNSINRDVDKALADINANEEWLFKFAAAQKPEDLTDTIVSILFNSLEVCALRKKIVIGIIGGIPLPDLSMKDVIKLSIAGMNGQFTSADVIERIKENGWEEQFSSLATNVPVILKEFVQEQRIQHVKVGGRGKAHEFRLSDEHINYAN